MEEKTQPTELPKRIELPFDPETITDPVACCEKIATILDETNEKPLFQITQIVEILGVRKSLKLLRKTLQISEDGGMMVYNQSRPRTVGGIYFFLAQRWVKDEFRCKIWPEMYHDSTFIWEDRLPLVDKALQNAGDADVPRIVLIGRPGRVIEKGNVVLTSMQRKQLPNSWPRGLPPMPDNEGPYIIYITAKQWRKVKKALTNQKDQLIVEGYPTFNSKLNAITVFAQRTTTKDLEQARREKQKMATS
jgi:hypothetical protein